LRAKKRSLSIVPRKEHPVNDLNGLLRKIHFDGQPTRSRVVAEQKIIARV
jgi:hypothetical protein